MWRFNPEDKTQTAESATLKRRTAMFAAARSACCLVERQERSIASGRGGVDRKRPLGGKAMEIARPAGLRPGAAQAFAAERLRPDDGTDHVAVDIAVADADPREDVAHRVVDSAVDA